MHLNRLSFALVAISFSVPVVACVTAASSETAGSAAMLTDAEKTACNFGFTETTASATDPSFPLVQANVLVTGKPILFGDVTGDGKADAIVISGKSSLAVYPGAGDGHFGAAIATALPLGADEAEDAADAVAIGDFDGDGVKDVVVAQSVKSKSGASRTSGRYVVAYGKAGGVLDAVKQALDLTAAKKDDLGKWHAAADLDADGKDDLLVAGTAGETVLFGDASRTLAASPTGITGTAARTATFPSGKSLVVATATELHVSTFAADRTVTEVVTAATFPHASYDPTYGDLDGDGVSELTFMASNPDKLTVLPVNGGAPTTFKKFDGMPIGIDNVVDLLGDHHHELLFKTDKRKLYATCGYSLATTEIVATPIVDFGDKNFIAGTVDLDGDGKLDVLTYDLKHTKLRAFLGGPPPSPAPALLSFVSDAPRPTVDAGVDDDASVDTDAGVVTVDPDAGTTEPRVDAGSRDQDAAVPPPPPPPVEVDAGPPPPPPVTVDAGTTNPPPRTGDDDDDDDTTGPTEPGKDAGTKKPTSSSSSSGSVTTKPTNGGSSSGSSGMTGTVTITEKPHDEDDGGCSTTPGSNGTPTGSLTLVGLVAAALIRRRRAAQT